MSNVNRTGKDFTKEERATLLKQFHESGLKFQDFAKEHNLNPATLKNWIWLEARPNHVHRVFSAVERKKTVETYLSIRDHQSIDEFSKAWGVSGCTLREWLRRYEAHGADGLMNGAIRKLGDKRLGMRVPEAVQAEIVKAKKAEPSFGIKRIAQNLFRFKGVKVSPNSVKKTINKEGLPLARKAKKKKRSTDKIRRFERAKPMQLWQSDITQYTLAVSSARVYLTVFMDDHSRYIVGHRLASRQTSDLVMDALKDACANFGKPQEVLTDQGRQYFAWRGKSDLEKYLEKQGIKHVVSRAHHPQTLGKCERFWETITNELWTRAKPQDLEEARVRIKHFIDYYNHYRPHQGIDGSVPADRFFGVASEVRLAIEKTVAQNAHALAIGELPQAPAFLIGQVGDQRVAFHGRGGAFYLTQNLEGEKNNGIVSELRNESSKEIAQSTKWAIGEPGEDDIPSGESNVDESQCRGKSDSDASSANHYGVLDGSDKQSSSPREVEFKTDPFLAALKPSDDGDDGRSFASAKVTAKECGSALK